MDSTGGQANGTGGGLEKVESKRDVKNDGRIGEREGSSILSSVDQGGLVEEPLLAGLENLPADDVDETEEFDEASVERMRLEARKRERKSVREMYKVWLQNVLWGRRFDFQKFCLNFAPGVSIILFYI